MVIITQNRTNKIVTTLTEKKVTTSYIYLFEFTNATSNEKFYTVATDLSGSKQRFNAFCITETSQSSGGTNPFDSEVSLALSGFYYYNVYENPNSVLNPSGLNKVETGKMLVIANKIVVNPTYQSAVNPNLVVFNPELFLNR